MKTKYLDGKYPFEEFYDDRATKNDNATDSHVFRQYK